MSEWRNRERVLRKVYYTSEIADEFKVREIAYYGFPVGAGKLPGILHQKHEPSTTAG